MIARWVRRYWPTLAVTVLVVATAAISLLGRSGLHGYHSAPPAAIYRSPVPGEAASVGGHSPNSNWLAVVLLILFLVLGSALVVVVLVYLTKALIDARRRRLAIVAAVIEGDDDREVLAAVDTGLAELADDGVDPRSAVIACWVRLEAIAMAAGIERRPGDTPAELITRLLDRYRVSEEALISLAELYRAARYSTRVIASAMRDDALVALGRLRDDLATSGAER